MALGAALTWVSGEEAPTRKLFTLPELENVLLTDTDMPGQKLLYQNSHHWTIAKPTIGKTGVENHEKVGITQAWVSQAGRELYVDYCALDTPEQAASGAAYYAASQAAVFREGLLTSNAGKLGDRSWVYRGAGILFVRGNFMVLVHDPVTKPEEQAGLEGIARVVLGKAEKELAKRNSKP